MHDEAEVLADSTFARVLSRVVQPIAMILLGLVAWFSQRSIDNIDRGMQEQAKRGEVQAALLADIKGKVDYGVIQRIESLERRQGELESMLRVTLKERANDPATTASR